MNTLFVYINDFVICQILCLVYILFVFLVQIHQYINKTYFDIDNVTTCTTDGLFCRPNGYTFKKVILKGLDTFHTLQTQTRTSSL